ncbi:MAG: DUF748 domain-containing protein [Candidatus Omnitrophota bacterium]
MKRIKKTIFLIVVLILLLFFISSGLVLLKGKDIFISQMNKVIDARINIKSLTLGFPINLRIKGLEIGDFLKGNFYVSPSILALLSGRLVINNLTANNLRVNLSRASDGTFNLPKLIEQKKKSPPPVILGLDLRSGKVYFVDKNVDPKGFNLEVKDININVSRKSFAMPPYVLKFKASAGIPTVKDETARVICEGWIDLLKKNMKGALTLENLDGVYFYPYYKNSVRQGPLKANVNFNADLEAKNNDLVANCHLEAKDVDFGPVPSGGIKENMFGMMTDILGNLSTLTDKVAVDFVVRTKLDAPQFKLAEIKVRITNKPLKEIIRKAPEVIQNIEDIGKQIKGIGKDFKEQFKGILEGAPIQPAPENQPAPAPAPESQPAPAPEVTPQSSGQ